MILFYDKKNGDIIGTVEGRVHDARQLGAWIGDKEKVGRIVCQWMPVMVVVDVVDSKGTVHSINASWDEWQAWLEDEEKKPGSDRRKYKIQKTVWEPSVNQKELFVAFDAQPTQVYEYRVNVPSLQLVLKSG